MTISFIELDFHHDVVDGFCRTFYNSETKVNFFIKKAVFDRLKNNNYIESKNFNWIIYNTGSRVEFLNSNISLINAANCVFINTLSAEPYAYSKVKFKPKVILRVHNVHKLFDPLNHIKIPLTPFFIWKAFSYTIRELIVGRYLFNYKSIQSVADYFSFPDEAIAEYALSNNYVNKNQLSPCFSFKVNEKQDNISEIKNYNIFRITIIGGVDKRRRDYETVIEALFLISNKLNVKVELTLLGNSNTAYGKSVINRIKSLENDYLKLIYFEQIVPQDIFDSTINNTNLLLCPIQVSSIVEIYHEVYGQTKISGAIHDSIRFPIFSLIPKNYKLDQEKAQYFDFYNDSAELAQKIILYTTNVENVKIKTEQYRNYVQSKYSAEAVRNEFTNFIAKL